MFAPLPIGSLRPSRSRRLSYRPTTGQYECPPNGRWRSASQNRPASARHPLHPASAGGVQQFVGLSEPASAGLQSRRQDSRPRNSSTAHSPMETIRIPDPESPPADAMARGADVLRNGGLVAFPTETVYGLGANALDAAAVTRIFEAKGRPGTNPLIVHVPDAAAARSVVAEWPPEAERLARQFWPGPLTLVLPKAAAIPAAVTAGGPTVAVRVPAHPVALALLRAAGASGGCPKCQPLEPHLAHAGRSRAPEPRSLWGAASRRGRVPGRNRVDGARSHLVAAARSAAGFGDPGGDRGMPRQASRTAARHQENFTSHGSGQVAGNGATSLLPRHAARTRGG